MSSNTFNYREQLVSIFWDLDNTISNLYQMGFNIGLEEEWQDFKESIKEGDAIPIDLEYLRAIGHPTLKGIIEMIEILVETRNTLANINQLSEEELVLPEGVYETEVAEDQDGPHAHYLDVWVQGLFGDLINLFEAIWVLAHGTEPPTEMYDRFTENYYEGGLEIESDDENVRFLLDALNRVLFTNGGTEYYA